MLVGTSEVACIVLGVDIYIMPDVGNFLREEITELVCHICSRSKTCQIYTNTAVHQVLCQLEYFF